MTQEYDFHYGKLAKQGYEWSHTDGNPYVLRHVWTLLGRTDQMCRKNLQSHVAISG